MKRLPFAYHVAFGALMGGWVAIQGLPRWWFGITLLIFLAATWGMYRWQLKASSRWVNGFRFGSTLWVAALMVAVSVGLLVSSNPKMPTFEIFTPLQGGLIAFLALTFLDWLWVKVYDSEVRGRP
jgi:FtsH-binding integral membrane protein